VTTGADQVKQLGQLDNEVVIVHSVERVVFEVLLVECLLERKAGQFLPSVPASVSTHVVFLNNLDETGKVKLGEQG
jgi:hypothetical protein